MKHEAAELQFRCMASMHACTDARMHAWMHASGYTLVSKIARCVFRATDFVERCHICIYMCGGGARTYPQKRDDSWLINMQRYGPPPAYPNLKIPGLNAPIPQGADYG